MIRVLRVLLTLAIFPRQIWNKQRRTSHRDAANQEGMGGAIGESGGAKLECFHELTFINNKNAGRTEPVNDSRERKRKKKTCRDRGFSCGGLTVYKRRETVHFLGCFLDDFGREDARVMGREIGGFYSFDHLPDTAFDYYLCNCKSKNCNRLYAGQWSRATIVAVSVSAIIGSIILIALGVWLGQWYFCGPGAALRNQMRRQRRQGYKPPPQHPQGFQKYQQDQYKQMQQRLGQQPQNQQFQPNQQFQQQPQQYQQSFNRNDNQSEIIRERREGEDDLRDSSNISTNPSRASSGDASSGDEHGDALLSGEDST